MQLLVNLWSVPYTKYWHSGAFELVGYHATKPYMEFCYVILSDWHLVQSCISLRYCSKGELQVGFPFIALFKMLTVSIGTLCLLLSTDSHHGLLTPIVDRQYWHVAPFVVHTQSSRAPHDISHNLVRLTYM